MDMNRRTLLASLLSLPLPAPLTSPAFAPLFPIPPGAVTGGWTLERLQLLGRMCAQGLPASQMARTLGGLARNAVIGKIHRFGWAQEWSGLRSSRAV
jgi:hypothetical protein